MTAMQNHVIQRAQIIPNSLYNVTAFIAIILDVILNCVLPLILV